MGKRYYYLDYLRGGAMVLVMVLHAFCNYFGNGANAGTPLFGVTAYIMELARCGVPLFFMISGFLMLGSGEINIKSFYKKRYAKIAVPFLLYSLFYYIIGYEERSIGGFIKELLNVSTAYHLWFIYAILLLYAIVPFIKMITDKCSDKLLWLFFGLVIFQTTIKPFLNIISGGRFYVFLTEDFMCGYMGYMILGLILGRCELKRSVRIVIYAAGALFFAITPLAEIKNITETGAPIFAGGYNINHYAEAAAIFLLAKRVVPQKGKHSFAALVSSVSLSAYFIHVFVMDKLWGLHLSSRISIEMAAVAVLTVLISFLWGLGVRGVKLGVRKLKTK